MISDFEELSDEIAVFRSMRNRRERISEYGFNSGEF